MRIAVIDGQGGGIGRHITEKLRRALSEETEIIALGTNSLATAAMLKAGANEGATGENQKGTERIPPPADEGLPRRDVGQTGGQVDRLRSHHCPSVVPQGRTILHPVRWQLLYPQGSPD